MFQIMRRHNVFVRTVAPYLIFLLLFMFVGWMVYDRTARLLREESIAMNRSLLAQSRTTLDRRFADIDRIVQELYGDSRLTRLQDIAEPFKGAATYLLVDTQKRMANYSLYNNFVFDYFIIYNRGNIVLSEDTIYETPKFYAQVLRIRDQPYAEWRDQWTNTYYAKEVLPAQDVIYGNQTRSLVTYLRSMGTLGFPKGVIAVLIDNKEIQKLLSGADIAGGGMAYILDEHGRVVSAVTSDPKRNMEAIEIPVHKAQLPGREGVIEPSADRPLFVTYATSAYNGWTYVVAQPKHVVLGKADYIKTIFFAVIALALAAGVALACLLAYRTSRPVQLMLNQISARFEDDGRSRGNMYRFIRDKLVSLLEHNEQLQGQIREQAPLLRSAFLERLLKGDIADPAEAAAQSKHVGVEMTEASYCAAIIVQLRGFEPIAYDADLWQELGVLRLRAKEQLAEAMGGRGLIHDMTADKIVLLVQLGDTRPDRCRSELDDLLKQANERLLLLTETAPHLAVGGLYPSLLELSRSFEEARQALNYCVWLSQPGIVYADELPQDKHLYYFPPEVQNRLINCATAGDEPGVDRIIQEIREANFTKRHLSIPMLTLLYHEIWGAVFRLYAKVGADTQPLLDEMAARTNKPFTYELLEEGFRRARLATNQICRQAGERKKSGNLELLGRIVAAIDSSFADQELCLESVAAQMGISRVYLSQFFKEQTGENFSDYLENVRMNRARRLLVHSGLPIHEIALQVGYGSPNTFGRAFKRIHGLSATAYRESDQAEGRHSPDS
ncbi:helix-turn-helix domain-containing protein [Paenibacillus methanolicus]|uniref:Helix-turn-helix protein n=1 Tax=Paenibacillus methanolicus TaxID=582686 RepID=A0A5S5CAQ3_9BACL|nr:helix-turn-helix domain-containing protein [Paenibacillus methanolicus]TYP76485.1 helix-turn-helix protein [Paenibacillus methanolicus]